MHERVFIQSLIDAKRTFERVVKTNNVLVCDRPMQFDLLSHFLSLM